MPPREPDGHPVPHPAVGVEGLLAKGLTTDLTDDLSLGGHEEKRRADQIADDIQLSPVDIGEHESVIIVVDETRENALQRSVHVADQEGFVSKGVEELGDIPAGILPRRQTTEVIVAIGDPPRLVVVQEGLDEPVVRVVDEAISVVIADDAPEVVVPEEVLVVHAGEATPLVVGEGVFDACGGGGGRGHSAVLVVLEPPLAGRARHLLQPAVRVVLETLDLSEVASVSLHHPAD